MLNYIANGSVLFLWFSEKPKSEQCLVRWAAPQLHDFDALAKMVDPALRGLYPPKSLSRFADVIALCVQVSVLLINQLLYNLFTFTYDHLILFYSFHIHIYMCVCVLKALAVL